MQPHDDVAAVIAEAAAEDVHATGMAGILGDATRSRIDECWPSARSLSVTFEAATPSMKVPRVEIRQVFIMPYCEPSSFHQAGVKAPRLSP